MAVGNRRVRVADLVGMGYLAELLTHPGQEIAALALASQGSAPREQDRHQLLDDTARDVYAARARELSAELAEAEAHNDIARRERLQVELDALVDQLEQAAGLGGRPRTFADSAERARTAVQKAIRRAIGAIDDADPAIADVLRHTVSTGTTCAYRPASGLPVVWTSGHSAADERPRATGSPAEDGLVPERTIGDWLDEETGRHFVGRVAELDLARTALDASVSPPFSVLYVHGPGGVGKTALLDRLASLAAPTGRRTVRLDLHTVEPTPSALLTAFAASVDRADGDVTPQTLAYFGRLLVLIDTVELGEPVLDWLRHELVASLALGTLVVIAGRNPPPPDWLADPAWRALSRVVTLDNLSEDEVGRYLRLHGVEAGLHRRLWALTRGHPLALSLVVDLLGQRTAREHDVADLMETPDVVRTLMDRFVGEIPDPRHREALAVCAHTRFTTEDLLRSAMGVDDASELFAWLRSRPFIEEGRYGLFPHDLARDVLDTDLRWRDRIGYEDLHVRIRAHLFGRVRASTGLLQQQAAADIIYLHRLNPIMRPLFDWPHLGNVRVERLTDRDLAPVLEMTERHQGATQAELARHWLDRQPAAFRVFRAADEVIGYTALLRLNEASDEDVAADPGTRALRDYAMTHEPPRPGETITAARFVVDRTPHQLPAAAFEGLSIAHILHTATTPGLTWDFIAQQSVDIEPMMNHIGYHRVPDAEFDVDGRHYFVFACDWRRLPWDDFVEMMGPRELDDGSTPPIRLRRRLADHVQPTPHVKRQPSGLVQGSRGLPTRSTRFFGRQTETSELRRLVETSRFLTLVGAPGCGKTRLGIELAAGLAPEFPDGVLFVELAPIGDPLLVPHAVADVTGARSEPGRSIEDAVVDGLADAECLLVLDNCEHVVAATAQLVARLRAACPRLRMLATSRVPVGLAGEQVWGVPPLDAPTAVELFADRAALAGGASGGDEGRAFGADDVNRPIGEQICTRLALLPLAIELAAAWTRVLSPAEILDRLGDALPLLRGGAQDVDPRQATMEATVDWSYRLLGRSERAVFDRLSVFAASFDLEAATAVAGSDDGGVLGALTSLVDHSLVVAEAAPGEPMRYRLLEPLRQFGEARLAARGEEDVVRRRHAEHYLGVAVRSDAELRGPARAAALRRVSRDDGNLLLALEWGRSRDDELGLRVCTALAPFWELRGRVVEGRTWLAEMLAADVADRRLRATALARTGRLAWRQRDYREARRLLEESLAIKRELGDPLGVARRLRALALVSMTEGDPDAAVRLCDQSLERFRAHGDEQGLVWTLIFLGLARYVGGDVRGGDGHLEEAVALGRRTGNVAAIAYALLYRCYGANVAGDPEAERRHLVGALAAMREAGGFVEEPDWLWAGTSLALTEGRVEAALRLAGGAAALSRRGGSQMNEQFVGHVEPRLARVVDDLGVAAADRLRAEGERMAFADLLAEATANAADSRRTGDADQPLSGREREVARLVAQGLTNAQIGERLFISRRTVESHVEHIKRKLGLGTRADIVAWAVRDAAPPAVPSNP